MNGAYSPIAVIGLACRFPDAPGPEAFWRNLAGSVESLRDLSVDQLRAAGVPEHQVESADYVRKGTVLDGVDRFDAAFFNVSGREARIMDPQHRILLECAWEALENAGYAGDCTDSIGIFAGAGSNIGWLRTLSARTDLDDFQIAMAAEKDYLASRIAYKLNLRGPAVTVQCACSTSLVAVELACLAVLNGECEVALAGGVSIKFPPLSGHLASIGTNFSPDGHCRPFDEDASGIRQGSGAGIVVLKPLDRALAGRDSIRAVILGSAATNDGSQKAGFAAPGVEGQLRAAKLALERAAIDPASVTFIEAQGNGARIGDSIEVTALRQAYGSDRSAMCTLGSVKGNIGHLDAAAGVAALIKTILALERAELPATVNFARPSSLIPFEQSRFQVENELRPWRPASGPRRAGVHATGIGGTSAHVILEQAPGIERTSSPWPAQLLVVSARTSGALQSSLRNLAAHLVQNPEDELHDISYTLQAGRRRFAHRWFAVVHSRAEALLALNDGAVLSVEQQANDRQVAFLCSGNADPVACRELCSIAPAYRHAVDGGADSFPETPHRVQNALGQMWISWGVRPVEIRGSDLLANWLARRHGLSLAGARPDAVVLDLARQASASSVLEALGRLWAEGVRIDWELVRAGEKIRRIPLPVYPLERRAFWPSGSDSEGEHRRADLSASYRAPATDTEQKVVGIWQAVLGEGSIGLDDDFAELGGDSLSAVQILARLQETFGVALLLKDFLDSGTPWMLSSRVDTILWATAAAPESSECEELVL